MALVYHRLVDVNEALKMVERALGGFRAFGVKKVPLVDALDRVLAVNVYAKVDSPPFDRSNVDGYAVIARDTYGATEAQPMPLRIVGRADVGLLPTIEVRSEECVEISTGAPMPRGADAVVMVEHTKRVRDVAYVYRAVTPGENVSQAGTDVCAGDLVLRAGRKLTPREIAVLAAVGYGDVEVYEGPRVAVFSTGEELVEPGKALEAGRIYDVNSYAICSMLTEVGAEAYFKGILKDDYDVMKRAISEALREYDVIIASGSTSAGFGDVMYKVFNEMGPPGVLVHGLKLKPGKPTILAVANGKLLVGLPGFPLSAIIVFMTIVRPIVERMAGLKRGQERLQVNAVSAVRVEAGRGKRELIPVQIVGAEDKLVAYPVLAGSGAATSLAISDGFVEVPEDREFVDEGEEVKVTLLSPKLRMADLTIIGSHCLGIDLIMELLNGVESKVINVGSTTGWAAVSKGEADIAGTHLLDEETMRYNTPFIDRFEMKDKAVVVRGYARKVGFIVKKGNPKDIKGFESLLRNDIIMINRNKGSGIRTLIDMNLKRILRDKDPRNVIKGYDYEAKTHTAVAAAIAQGRADVGIAIQAVCNMYDLDFIEICEEMFDFLIRKDRLKKGSVSAFLKILASEEFKRILPLRLKGYRAIEETGRIVG